MNSKLIIIYSFLSSIFNVVSGFVGFIYFIIIANDSVKSIKYINIMIVLQVIIGTILFRIFSYDCIIFGTGSLFISLIFNKLLLNKILMYQKDLDNLIKAIHKDVE